MIVHGNLILFDFEQISGAWAWAPCFSLFILHSASQVICPQGREVTLQKPHWSHHVDASFWIYCLFFHMSFNKNHKMMKTWCIYFGLIWLFEHCLFLFPVLFQRITCVDILMCQCCSSDGKTFCDVSSPSSSVALILSFVSSLRLLKLTGLSDDIPTVAVSECFTLL